MTLFALRIAHFGHGQWEKGTRTRDPLFLFGEPELALNLFISDIPIHRTGKKAMTSKISNKT